MKTGNVKKVDDDTEDDDTEENDHGQSDLYSCSSDGCIKTFRQHKSMLNHINFGKCQYDTDRETLMDKAAIKYCKLIHEENQLPLLRRKDSISQNKSKTEVKDVEEGWALKRGRHTKRFNDKQRKYLDEKFDIGVKTGKKYSPDDVANDMRGAVDIQGHRLFSLDELFTSKQVQGYFSRRSGKQKGFIQTCEDHMTRDDIQENQEEFEYQEIRHKVVESMNTEHPIIFDNYNLCELSKNNRLNSLGIRLLSRLCDEFDIPSSISSFTGKRKAPFIDALKTFITNCSCMKSD